MRKQTKQKGVLSLHALVSFCCEHVSFVQVQELKPLPQFSGGKPVDRDTHSANPNVIWLPLKVHFTRYGAEKQIE